jgi:hypothetical protein
VYVIIFTKAGELAFVVTQCWRFIEIGELCNSNTERHAEMKHPRVAANQRFNDVSKMLRPRSAWRSIK